LTPVFPETASLAEWCFQQKIPIFGNVTLTLEEWVRVFSQKEGAENVSMLIFENKV